MATLNGGGLPPPPSPPGRPRSGVLVYSLPLFIDDEYQFGRAVRKERFALIMSAPLDDWVVILHACQSYRARPVPRSRPN